MIPGSANPLLLKSAAAAGGYQIERSLRFSSNDSGYLSRTPSVAGNRKTWTWAGWVKRTVKNTSTDQMLFAGGATSSDTGFLALDFNSSDKLRLSSAATNFLITTAVYRDAAAWMHIVLAFDATQGTNANKVKLYVNGTEVTAFDTDGRSSIANQDYGINQAAVHEIGRATLGSNKYFDGCLADIHFIDGQALTPSSFTEVSATTGQLIPKQYTGSFGTNGFWLKFSDNSAATATTLGKDYSGNSNNWTPNNLSVTAGAGNDSLVDTPTSYGTDTGAGGEVRGNYCTWNPLAKNSAITLANGNLDTSNSGGASDGLGLATIAASTGKFYWEVAVNTASAGRPIIGVVPTVAGLVEVGSGNANSVGYRNTGVKRINGSDTSYGNSYTNGDVIGVALDLDNGAIYFSKNGTFQNSGSPTSGSSKTGAAHTWTGGSVEMTPGISEYNSSCSANWGQRAFAYTAPSGFKALCDTNLPAPVIAKSSTAFDVKLFSGNGSTQNITGFAFSPDFAWFKRRSSAFSHELFDVIRGGSNVLFSDLTSAEANNAALVTSFNSDGVSVGSALGANGAGVTSVMWAWDAGTSTVTNTQGSITSQVRANVSAGFSIVTYTGNNTTSTVGHGLGVTPGLVIVKSRSASSLTGWMVKHSSLVSNYNLALNLLDAAWNPSTNGYIGNLTSSTTFELVNGSTNGNNANQSGVTYVAYCFAPVVGYSSFGSYTGNGSADGPFVFTGHRSRWLMVRRSDAGLNDWYVLDTARSTYNVAINELLANSSSAENPYTGVDFDLLSNGFKIRATEGSINASGGTFIYASFAEFPFAYARAR